MRPYIKKTKNYQLINRLDVKIFGKEEANDEDPAKTIWFLLIVSDKIAGFAGITPFVEEGQKYGFLERAGLLKEFRGKGLQRDLIAIRDKEATRLKLNACFTYTARDNHKSSNNLIACGYRLYEPLCKYGIKQALYWRKAIGDKTCNVS